MTTPPRDSKRSTRDKAAAARAAADSVQRRRDNRIRIFGGLAILVVVALIVGLGVWGSKQGDTTPGGIVTDAKVPAGVNANTGDYAWAVPAAKPAAAGAPTLSIWEDFQCPSCAALETGNGPAILKLATDGKVNLVWRPTTFLDPRFLTGANPKSSHRATMAWGCAIDAGKADEYHSVIFAHQPATEGDGWSDQELLDYGTEAGITGAAFVTFSACYDAATYDQWVTNSYQTFIDQAVPGTPAAFLNGTEVPPATLLDTAALEKLIADATGK